MGTRYLHKLFVSIRFVLACVCFAPADAATPSYNSADRLTRLAYDSRSYTTYTYDLAGNLTSITTRPPPTLDVDGDGASTSKDALLLLRYQLR